MEVIPLDPSLAHGPRGRPTRPEDDPLVMSQRTDLLDAQTIQPTDVCELILGHLTSDRRG